MSMEDLKKQDDLEVEVEDLNGGKSAEVITKPFNPNSSQFVGEPEAMNAPRAYPLAAIFSFTKLRIFIVIPPFPV